MLCYRIDLYQLSSRQYQTGKLSSVHGAGINAQGQVIVVSLQSNRCIMAKDDSLRSLPRLCPKRRTDRRLGHRIGPQHLGSGKRIELPRPIGTHLLLQSANDNHGGDILLLKRFSCDEARMDDNCISHIQVIQCLLICYLALLLFAGILLEYRRWYGNGVGQLGHVYHVVIIQIVHKVILRLVHPDGILEDGLERSVVVVAPDRIPPTTILLAVLLKVSYHFD
mmetsp:Transcript_19593/g.56402  ORF Transcript_19593/g.56402 Transcript_19593/m.56402 type:complete len:223 (+) Transcript_19593:875-1543(+)